MEGLENRARIYIRKIQQTDSKKSISVDMTEIEIYTYKKFV